MTKRRLRILAASAATLAALLMVELGCRIAEWRASAKRAARTEVRYILELATRGGTLLSDEPGTIRLLLDPGLGFRLARSWSAPGVHLNALGLRGPEASAKKPPGTFRIVLTGGSVAFGWNAPSDAGTPAALLQALLDSPARRVEVLDAGCPAYTVTQELQWLSLELLDLEPDLVVSLTGHNDLWDAWSGEGLVSHELFEQVEQRLEDAHRLGPALIEASALGRRLRRKLAAGRRSDAPKGVEVRREAAGIRFEAVLRRMAAVTGGRLLVALQPESVASGGAAEPAFKAWHAAMCADQRRALEALEPLGARGVDLRDALPAAAFTDLVHLTEEGNARLAGRLAEAIRAHPAWRAGG